MFRRFLNWLEQHDRKRVILDRQGESPYLERYYIFIKDRVHCPFNIFLHKFLRSDSDDLHDHPWPYMTIVLKGGYWEWIPKTAWNPITGYDIIIGEQRLWRGPGHFRLCKATSLHRIELNPDVSDCWTLFIPGKRKREWGFLTHRNWKNQKWVDNETYISEESNV